MNEIIVGNVYRTNLSQPGGLVLVLSTSPAWFDTTRIFCTVLFIENHPYGYSKGDRGGGYMAEDLMPADNPYADCPYLAQQMENGSWQLARRDGLPVGIGHMPAHQAVYEAWLMNEAWKRDSGE